MRAVDGERAGRDRRRVATGRAGLGLSGEVATSDAALRQVLHGLPGVDQVATEARAAGLATRSIKRDAKMQALDMAIRMVDLTTLEGADTPGKVRAMCAKARRPDPADPAVPPVAAVCVYPDLVGVARAAAGGQRGRRGVRGHRVPVRPGVARGQARRRARRRGRRRRRGGHGHRPGRVPGRPVRPGLRGDPAGARGLRHRAPQGDPGDRRAGHPRQRLPGVLAGDAGGRGLHQDLDRQGHAGRDAPGRAGHAGRGARLRAGDRPPRRA